MQRLVKPEHEIPSVMLEPSAIKDRLSKRKSAPVSKKGGAQLKKAFAVINDKAVNIEVFEKFYRHLDSYIRHDVAPYSICTQGCSQCCHVKVDVSLLEAWYISEKANVELDVNPHKQAAPSTTDEVACTFLKEGGCSIYEYRPIACRTFHTIDHWKYCYNNEKHEVYTLMSQPDLANVHAHLMRSGHDGISRSYADIRQWFPK